MGIWDKIYENAGYAYAQHLHRGEVKALEAALKQKDATIQTMEKHVGLLEEKSRIVETQYQGLQDQVNELQGNLAMLDVNHPPTIDLINDTTASATSVFSSSEGLGSTLDEMSDAVGIARLDIDESVRHQSTGLFGSGKDQQKAYSKYILENPDSIFAPPKTDDPDDDPNTG